MVEQIRRGDIPGVQLRYRHALPTDPRVVWRWLTRPELLAQWLAHRAYAEDLPQAGVQLETSETGDRILRERLVLIGATEPVLLVYDLQQLEPEWPAPTRLTFELTAHAGQTEVSVLQEGFAQLPLSDCLTIWEAYRRRWRAALSRLAQLVSA